MESSGVRDESPPWDERAREAWTVPDHSALGVALSLRVGWLFSEEEAGLETRRAPLTSHGKKTNFELERDDTLNLLVQRKEEEKNG